MFDVWRGCSINETRQMEKGARRIAEANTSKNNRHKVTAAFVNWMLWELPYLRSLADELEQQITQQLSLAPARTNKPGSSLEELAIKRAAITHVLDVVDRAIKNMTPEQRRIYRLRYRGAYTIKEVAKRVNLSKETVVRRLTNIKVNIAEYLQQVPASDLYVFRQYFDEKLTQK